MPFLRKYNTLTVTGTTAIRIPIIKRAVVDFAVSADWTPVAGDVKIAVDGTAPANVANLPTAVTSGNGAFWEFILTAAELTCKQAVVTVVDASTKAVEDQCFVVETFGNASAMYQADLSAANLPVNVVTIAGTSQTGRDIGASVLLSAGSGAGQLDFTSGVVKANTTQFAGQTVSAAGAVTMPGTVASATNITAGTITTVTNLTNAPTAGDFTATMKTSLNAATPASVTGAVASVTGNVGGNVVGSVGSVTGAVGSIANAGIDGILDRAAGVETNFTLRQALRLMLSSTVAKLSGAATATVTIRDINDTKNRITATVDANGNRSAITTDVT